MQVQPRCLRGPMGRTAGSDRGVGRGDLGGARFHSGLEARQAATRALQQWIALQRYVDRDIGSDAKRHLPGVRCSCQGTMHRALGIYGALGTNGHPRRLTIRVNNCSNNYNSIRL